MTRNLKQAAVRQHPNTSPFALDDDEAYRAWRAQKLHVYPTDARALVVPVANPRAPTMAERVAMRTVCRKTNMVFYASPPEAADDAAIVRGLGAAFGLRDLDRNLLADDDGVSTLEVMPEKAGRGYIPYSDKRLLWHTDGYYNPPERRIRAFLLHCVRPAAEGGENRLLDHEIAYIQLRDADPEFIHALMHPEAMTIPANTDDETARRAAQPGQVYAVDSTTGRLHMRYTARARSVLWRDDSATRAAVAFLAQLLAGESPYVFRHRSAAGAGLLCNNVLHNRTAFVDRPGAAGRRVYRARYYNRIDDT